MLIGTRALCILFQSSYHTVILYIEMYFFVFIYAHAVILNLDQANIALRLYSFYKLQRPG